MQKIYKNTRGLKLEVIFVDDNSNDGSDKIFKPLKKNLEIYFKLEIGQFWLVIAKSRT